MPFRDAFRARLKSERQRNDLTQAEAAERLGVSLQAYGNLERNGADWVDTLGKLAKAVGSTPERLCAGYTGRGRKKDKSREIRAQIMDEAEGLPEDDLLMILDLVKSVRKRRGS